MEAEADLCHCMIVKTVVNMVGEKRIIVFVLEFVCVLCVLIGKRYFVSNLFPVWGKDAISSRR
jgi:hypothetical protein